MMHSPEPENYWRGVILFGRNSSTYKMALGKLLLGYSYSGLDRISLDDLASDFLSLYIERTENNHPQQGVMGRKTIVEHQIDLIRHGDRSFDSAVEVVKAQALSNMVLVKFNNLFGTKISKPFYSFTPGDSEITLNANLLRLSDSKIEKNSLESEILGRWDLLEHAYERTRIAPLSVDERMEYLINAEDRKVLTPLIPMIEGYQQGRCFYCGRPLYDIHVDHVIPFSAIHHNDVWNLVLAHAECNEQKSDSIPSKLFIDRLILRNEYYISSSHPLKDEIIRKTGNSSSMRKNEIYRQYRDAYQYKGRFWRGDPSYNPEEDKEFIYWIEYYAPKI
ncbi:MAG: HNH endonuclease [Euryarchaeota archaeon]|nr:HNH endonuclease [Euryarchaeota archaeon]